MYLIFYQFEEYIIHDLLDMMFHFKIFIYHIMIIHFHLHHINIFFNCSSLILILSPKFKYSSAENAYISIHYYDSIYLVYEYH